MKKPKSNIKAGDTVQTIKGLKKVLSMNKDIVRFNDGFAPIDMVRLIKS